MVDRMRKRGILYGLALNDANYPLSRKVNGSTERCPFYCKWVGMLERCYSEPFKIKWPTYAGCTVCDEWLTFSKFKSWMEKQDWQGKQLDKDILVKGNKVYSPETCVFVSAEINYFVRDSSGSRGEYPIGVSWHKINKKFVAQCKNPITKKGEQIGFFDNVEDAHMAWRRAKHKHAMALASKCDDSRVSDALIARYA